MIISWVFTLAVIIIIGYVIFRILSDIAKGLALFLIVLIAYFIAFKSIPNFSQFPIVGKYISSLKSPTGVLSQIKSLVYRLKIIPGGRASNDNLLIIVKNDGFMPLSNFSVLIDNKRVNITNRINKPLMPGASTILEVNWKKSYRNITVITNQIISSL